MRTSVLYGKEDMRMETRDNPTPGVGEVLVRFGYGGICGSDLHYYFEAANGNFRVRHPFTIGHEMSGTVVDVGEGVTQVAAGDRVAVNPGRACGECDYCRAGTENLCRRMVFFGSASTDPHTDGAFQEYVVVRERQVIPLPPDFDLSVAAIAEPLAVSLHAVNRAGPMLGKRVLVTGAGTIGSLVLLAARALGAVTVDITDIMDERLDRALACGASRAINVASGSADAEALANGELEYDVVLEASGNTRALKTGLDVVVKGGTIVQVGTLPPGEVGIDVNRIMSREINFLGTFRFGTEFDAAVDYLVSGRIDVWPIITHRFAFTDLAEAFDTAKDGTQSTKVQLYFPE